LHEGGLAKMHQFISETAKWGDLISGPRVIDAHVRENMQGILSDIQEGVFASRWIQENKDGQPEYRRLMAEDMAHPIEKVGTDLRGRMSWLNEEN
jgi:ketol-acid reductoisomerase